MKPRERLLFVMPPSSQMVSGGNIYNRQLVDAVRRRRPIEEVSEAAWAAQVDGGDPSIWFIDTVSLAAFLGARAGTGQRALLVVHHLPSLEPGIADDDPALALERAALPRFDGFLTTSPYTTALLRDRGHQQPCLTVRPALPDRPRPPLELRPGVRALLVANLIPRKGVAPFVRALAAARRPGDQLTVDVVGRADLDPACAADCARAIAEAGLDRGEVIVHLRGPASYEEMDALYRGATLFLSTSQMETFGMALQEARAFGVPILACRGGNASAHVEHGVTGALCETVTELVEELLDLSRAPERLASLFAAAQSLRTGSEYTWDVAAEEFLRQLGDFERGEP